MLEGLNMGSLELTSATKTMRCRACNKELQVNTNYMIHEVTCNECYHKQRDEHAMVGNT